MTGDGREVNRHNYTLEEIEQAVQRPVVKRLMQLIRFRNEHEAFQGEFQVMDTEDHELKLKWDNGGKSCLLHVDFENFRSVITFTNAQGQEEEWVL